MRVPDVAPDKAVELIGALLRLVQAGALDGVLSDDDVAMILDAINTDDTTFAEIAVFAFGTMKRNGADFNGIF